MTERAPRTRRSLTAGSSTPRLSRRSADLPVRTRRDQAAINNPDAAARARPSGRVPRCARGRRGCAARSARFSRRDYAQASRSSGAVRCCVRIGRHGRRRSSPAASCRLALQLVTSGVELSRWSRTFGSFASMRRPDRAGCLTTVGGAQASPPNQVRRKKEATDASCLPGTSTTTLRLLLGARGARRRWR